MERSVYAAGLVTDSLNVVSVRIKHEGAEVVRVIAGAKTGSTIASTTSC